MLTVARMFMYVMEWIFTYIRIFPLFVDWKRWDEGKDCVNGKVGEGVDELFQSKCIFLSNFMVAKCLFWFEYELYILWEILFSDNDD